MVVRIGQAQSRGAAGQTGMSRRGQYNFANLYKLNRATDQSSRQVNQIAGNLRNAQTTVDRAGRQGAEAARQGNSEGVNNATNTIAGAIEDARNGASEASSYDPSVAAMKSGASAYQAGVADFYAGGTAAKQRARKFSGIYDAVRNTGTGLMQRLPGQLQQGVADRNSAYERDQANQLARRNAIHQGAYRGYDQNLDKGPNGQARRMDNLTWMLKTGRISADDMYKAQKDEQFYRRLMQKFS